MLQFISLSSGSSGNSYYLNYNGYGLVIDVGIGIRSFKRHFQNYGLALAQIRAVLVTHDHTDHVKAVGSLARDFRVPVYSSEKVLASIMKNHYVSKKIPEDLQRPITKGEPLTIGPFRVTPFHVPHDSADNNGYAVEVGNSCLVVMTDIGHFTPEMEEMTRKATHLIIESNYDEAMLAAGPYPARLKKRIRGPYGHISNDETAAFLARELNPQLIRNIWLCHLSAENNLPRIAYETTAKALAEAGMPVEGDSASVRLEVLARLTPSLLVTLED